MIRFVAFATPKESGCPERIGMQAQAQSGAQINPKRRAATRYIGLS